MTKKRAWALYRVSSNKQVGEENDIPQQETQVRDMVTYNSAWELDRELYELGVSAYKKSSKQRDVLQEIMSAASSKQFEVLVVFNSDRIGRHEDSAPFVKKLIQMGIEIWSATEGQIAIDDYTDEIIIDIKYWVNRGESKKISKRTTPSVRQNLDAGGFKGGRPPIGFKLVFTGEYHHKTKRALQDFAIDEDESNLVKMIYDLADQKGYGAERIARILNDDGLTNRNGGKWFPNIVNRILNNPVYNGRQRYNMTQTVRDGEDFKKMPREEWKYQPQRPEWIIIEDEQFNRVQELQEGRRKKNPRTTIGIANKGKMLLNGFAYCGYCGSKLYVDYSFDYKIQNGEKIRVQKYRYKCSQVKHVSDNLHEIKMFTAKKYDPIVEQTVLDIINQADLKSFADDIKNNQMKQASNKEKEYKKLFDQRNKLEMGLEKLQAEIMKVLMGDESNFTEENLSKAIKKAENDISEITIRIEQLDKELKGANQEIGDADALMKELLDWERRYINADLDTKKTMLGRIIRSIHLKKDNIDIDFIFRLDDSGNVGIKPTQAPATLLYKHTQNIG